MKLLLVDLDDTLINTKTFKNTLFSILAETHQVSPGEIAAVYEVLKKENNMENWKARFQAALEKKLQKEVELKKPISNSIGSLTISKSIIDYVVQFEGHKAIFTYGDPDIQNEKIRALHLADYFDEIIITTARKDLYLVPTIDKQHVMLNGRAYHEVTLIDNDETLLTVIKAKFPWIKTINTLDLV